jgi:hypothetical protein
VALRRRVTRTACVTPRCVTDQRPTNAGRASDLCSSIIDAAVRASHASGQTLVSEVVRCAWIVVSGWRCAPRLGRKAAPSPLVLRVNRRTPKSFGRWHIRRPFSLLVDGAEEHTASAADFHLPGCGGEGYYADGVAASGVGDSHALQAVDSAGIGGKNPESLQAI